MQDFHIAPVTKDDIVPLATLLIDTVAAGGSVSFMHPLSRHKANEFWRNALDDMDKGGRIVLGAYRNGQLAATVSLILDLPENQPHRAEIGKMMTALAYRGQGGARALLRAAEQIAIERGKTLLVLDTAADGGAAGLYEKAGFTCAGMIPDFAHKPHGGLSGTLLFWKRIGPS